MDKLWTTAEAAAYLKIQEADVERLVREGRLTSYKLAGQFLRFQPQQVKELRGRFFEASSVAAADAPAISFRERARDWMYFNDLYVISGSLLAALVAYFLTAR